ncbi:MAG: DUF6235 family protein [Labedaea sp.]
MNERIESRNVAGPRFRLEAGVDVLEQWAATAHQAHKNVVYKALFAISDGSVFRDYIVFDDANHAGEYSVLVRDDLIIRVAVHGLDAFAIRYIGSVSRPVRTADVNRR